MATTTQVRRAVLEEWSAQLPCLGRVDAATLGRRVGPLLQGVYLGFRSADSPYVPRSFVQSLLDDFDHIAFTLGRQLKSERTGGPQSFRLVAGSALVAPAALAIVRQSRLAVEGDLSLTSVLEAYDLYFRPGEADDGYPLFEMRDTLRLLSWANRREDARARLERYLTLIATWSGPVWRPGESLTQWRAEREADIARTDWEAVLAESVRRLKLEKLPVAQIIGAQASYGERANPHD